MEQQGLSYISVAMQNGTATLEDSFVVPYKTKHTLTIQSNGSVPWYLPRGVEDVRPHKNLHMSIYRSFIHNCQNLETAKMPVFQ